MIGRPLRNGLRTVLLVAAMTAISAGGARAATTSYVEPNGVCHKSIPCYTTIQGAINNSAAGDIVIVYGGTYHEHVVLDRPLILGGKGAKIDADGSGTALRITTTGAIVTRFDIRDGDVGVALEGASGNQLDSLHISDVGRGMLFSSGSTANVTTNTDIHHAALYGVDVGDSGNFANQFMRMKLHDSGTGFNAYAGSNGLVLQDSSVTKNVTGVQIGWSGAWGVVHNEITRNSASGIVTDTVSSGAITHNYIARNGDSGIVTGGFFSTFTAQDNRIEGNGLSGVTLCNQAQAVQLSHNMVLGNGRYGVEICDGGGGNQVAGNYLFTGVGLLGDALDDQGSNTWAGNFYSTNPTGTAPFTIPGTAGAQDATPLAQAALPKPATKADCKDDGWWLLTDGALPFKDKGACDKSLH